MKHHGHLLLEEQELAPGAEWPPAGACWCLARVSRGQGYWLEKGQAREVSAGMLLVVPPQHPGSLRASQLGELQVQSFQFCPDLMSGLLSMSERLAFDRLAAAEAQRVRMFAADTPVAAQFARVQARAEKTNGLLLRSQLLEIVGMAFGAELKRPRESNALTLSARKRLKVLLEHLTEEEFLSASIEQLSAYCGCSLRHFSRLFRQNYGVSLRARQTDLRLLKARRMLEETDSRVMTIAAQCGYTHLGVFNALFKKRFGTTPTEFRRGGNSKTTGTPDQPASCPGPRGGNGPAEGAVVTEKSPP